MIAAVHILYSSDMISIFQPLTDEQGERLKEQQLSKRAGIPLR